MNLAKTLTFYNEINALKKTIRYSYYNNACRESTAEHSWRVALIAMDLHQQLSLDVDLLQSIKIALAHDIPEYNLQNDIDASLVAIGKVSKEYKKDLEEKTMRDLDEKYNIKEIHNLWKEYRKKNTRESKFINLVDKLEATLHIIDRNDDVKNQEFMVKYPDNSSKDFPDLILVVNELKQKVKEFFKEKEYEWKQEWETSHLVIDINK